MIIFDDSEIKVFRKHCEKKGENAGSQHFLFFPQCFATFSKRICTNLATMKVSPANAFNKINGGG